MYANSLRTMCVCVCCAGWNDDEWEYWFDHWPLFRHPMLRLCQYISYSDSSCDRSKSIDLAASPWRQRIKMLSDSFGPSSFIEVVNSQPVNFLTLYTFSFCINHTQLDAHSHAHKIFILSSSDTLTSVEKHSTLQHFRFGSVLTVDSSSFLFLSSSLSLLSGVCCE